MAGELLLVSQVAAPLGALLVAGVVGYFTVKFSKAQVEIARTQADTAKSQADTAKTQADTAKVQSITAKAKLRLDLYDKRLHVFDVTLEAIQQLIRSGPLSAHDDLVIIRQFYQVARKSRWLFDIQLSGYLAEVLTRIVELQDANRALGEMRPLDQGREMYVTQIRILKDYLEGQLAEVEARFDAFLKLEDFDDA